MSIPSIGIIGAGPGGLTLAIACHRAGLDNLTVYEQAPAIEPIGVGVQLSANATRVLQALGLGDALRSISFYPQAVHLRSARSGYLIAMRPLGRFAEDRYGAPYYHVHRGDLQQILLERTRELGIRVETGQRLTTITEEDTAVEVRFASGASGRHAVIVGCDGIHSTVRKMLFDDSPARYTGHLAWRGTVPAERLPAKLLEPVVTAWLGPARHFVNYFVRGGELVNFVGVIEDTTWQSDAWLEPGDPERLRQDFANWHPVIGHIIDAADEVFRWALHDHAPLTQWTTRRVALLGDACHPMLPYLAQGAAMAIEDAWVLSRMLDQWEDEPHHGLTDYQRYRLPRTTRVQQEARRQGEEFHLSDRWQVIGRNLKLGFGSRYLPDIAMQQIDWLYGYDCVKGFA